MNRLLGQNRIRRRAEAQPLTENPARARDERRRGATKIDPALKSWFDQVIVPSLIQAYLKREGNQPLGSPLPLCPGQVYARHDVEQENQ